jgi:UDP-N-acetylmuramate dehydrogenase
MIQENISLLPYNTFHIGAVARFFASITSAEQAQEISQSLLVEKNICSILGGGSNILFTKDYDGLIIKNEIPGIELINETEDFVFIKSGAGVIWHDLVMYCIERNYGGIENLALIPGCVGASPIQNIGAYGVEVKDVIHVVEAVKIFDRKIISFSNSECHFGYRESVFKNKYKNQFIITSVTYRLRKVPQFNISYGAIPQELERMGVKDLSIKDIALAVMNIRNSKLPNPKVIGNAGSFFKNPEITISLFDQLKSTFPNIVGHATENNMIKVAAGWLIEQAGWKGFRDGDAGCHDKQALVLVNHGNATGSQILELSEKIINSVNDKFGIVLSREVNVW